jgi:hypothetical protein
MSDTTRCPSCGHPPSAADVFCPRCGASLPGSRTAPEAAPGQGPEGDAPDPLAELLRTALQPSFLLVRRLGIGGMGSVYLAREPSLRRLVAVKVLAPDLAANAAYRTRFEREAQAVAGFSHPNVVAIHGVGELGDGTPYFVMQYVSGRSLAARIDAEGPLEVDEARRITGEVASALAAAHAKGIIHRDIKPANILYDDESGRALVSDFGIAAVISGAPGVADTRLTQTGMAIGTPQYMSPEQLLSEAPTDRTDVYALGLLGYEMVSGSGPFAATSPQELIAAHLRDTPKALSRVRPDMDPEFERLVAACLDKDPKRRPSAADVARRLAPGVGALLEWPPPGLDGLHGGLRRIGMLFWLGGALLSVCLVGFVALGPRLATDVSAGTLFLIICAAGATVVSAGGAARLARTARAASAAVRRGYTWLTLAETMADARGDTGALVAGVREYSSLDETARGHLRRARMIREALVFAGGILPLLIVLPLLWLAATGVAGARSAPFILLAPSVAALLGAAVLERHEGRAVAGARAALARRRHRRDDTGRLIEPWYASFDSVRGEQALGRGRPGRSRLGAAGALALAAIVLVGLVVLLPLWSLAALGPGLLSAMLRPGSGTPLKARMAEFTRPYVLPPDSSITPRAAGEALYVLSMAGQAPSSMPYDRPRPRQLDTLPHLQDDRLFGPRPAWSGPNMMTVLDIAARGLTAEQRRYLETLAAHPMWREFTTVARAPKMDYLGARFVVPFPAGTRVEALPLILRFAATKEVAYANTSRAALALANGRPADAERMLRETISFGFRIVDDATTTFEQLVGVVIVGIGRDGLLKLYTTTHRPEAALLQARVDSLRAMGEAGSDDSVAAGRRGRTVRERILATASDPGERKALRFEMLYATVAVTCSNARELLFGPAADVDSAFSRVRRDVARFASDSAFIDLIEARTRQGPPPGIAVGAGVRLGLARSLVLGLAHSLGALAGNPRIGGCAELGLILSAPSP